MSLISIANKSLNTVVRPLLDFGPSRRLLGHKIAVMTYTGRRSGRTYSTPTFYERDGDEVTITVRAPSYTTWWRNFTRDGHPVTLRLRDEEREGHAIAVMDADGSVFVRVSFTHTA